jgi:hypothetical protein
VPYKRSLRSNENSFGISNFSSLPIRWKSMFLETTSHRDSPSLLLAVQFRFHPFNTHTFLFLLWKTGRKCILRRTFVQYFIINIHNISFFQSKSNSVHHIQNILEHLTKKGRIKYSYPCSRSWIPIGSWYIEDPAFLDNRLTDGGEFDSFMSRTRRKISSTHFC